MVGVLRWLCPSDCVFLLLVNASRPIGRSWSSNGGDRLAGLARLSRCLGARVAVVVFCDDGSAHHCSGRYLIKTFLGSFLFSDHLTWVLETFHLCLVLQLMLQ